MKIGTTIVIGTVIVVAAGYGVYRLVKVPKVRSRATNPSVYVEAGRVSPKVLALAHPNVDTDALADFVVEMEESAQVKAYNTAHRIWTKDFVGSKEDLVRRVLHEVAPGPSWSMPRAQMRKQDQAVWDAAAWLVELMGASVEEKAREPMVAGGAR